MASKAAVPAKKVGKSLADFRAAHDKDFIIPVKIKAAIAALGPDGWEYDGPFTKMAGVSSSDMSIYRDQFVVFQVTATPTKAGGSTAPRIVWAGSAAFAKRLGGPRQLTSE